MDSTLLGLQPAWTALAGLLTLAVVYNLSQLLSKPPPPSGIPIALKDEVPDEKERIERYMSDTRELLIHGYTKFKNQVFGISTTEGTSVVLPLQLLDDLRGQRSLTFASFLEKQFTLKKYTKLGNLTEQQIQVLNKEFNPSLPAYIPVIHRLICDFFPFGACEVSTIIKPYIPINRLVSRLCARMFLGDEAARSEWLDIASVYIKSAEHYVGALKRWPSSLRSLVYPFVHGRRQMRTQFNQGRQIVSEALRKKRTTAGAATTCNPPSLLDLFSSGKFADSVHNDEEHAVTQMNLCVAAIQAQSATVMQCVVDLSAYPEYVPELREEIEAALRSTNGEWNKDSLGQLLKLDSFLKETQRLNSPDLISLQRKTRDPLKLSNGLHLPKGITLLLPTGAINMDPAYFDSPEQFDGFRYYKQRLRSEDDATRHQLVTVGKKDLAWGYGRHACPGRFMADVVMKMIMVEFVMRYDIRAPSSGVARPENIITEGILAPDPNWEVALKQRL